MSLAVLIPHKNSFVKLKRLLETVPSSCQIVVVDDNSRADQLEKVQALISNELKHVNLILNTSPVHNAGVARNIALTHCNADWVIFADADDMFDSAAFLELQEYLKTSPAEVVFFGCKAIKEDTGEPSHRCDTYRQLLQEWPGNKDTICYQWMVPWGKAIRKREVIDKFGLRFASRIASNDVEFASDLAIACNEIEVFDRTVYICFESNTSLTASINPPKALDRLEAAMNRSFKFYKRRVPVYYNYNFGLMRNAFPLIVKEKRFGLLTRYVSSVGISLVMNFKYCVRRRAQSPTTRTR